MATKFFWATCACVTSFATLDVSPGRPLEAHSLGEFVRKCEYHRLMEDSEAFAELRSSHLSMALAVRAAREIAYGDALNPIKHHEMVYDFLCAFEPEDRKRAIVFNPLFLPQGKDAQILARAKRETFGHDVRIGKLKPTGKVALFFGAPSTSHFSGSFGTLVGGAAPNSTEARAQITLSVAGTLSRLALNNTSGGTVSHTARVRKNGADGNLVVTQTSEAAGFGEDTSNSDSVAADDEFGLAFTDSGTNPIYAYLRTIFEASSGHSTFLFASSATGVVCDQTVDRYHPFAGALSTDGGGTEANEQLTCRAAGTASYFQVGVSTNVGVSSRIFRFRKNASDGNQLVTFLAGATGIAIDTVNTDSIVQDDAINDRIVPLLATDDITVFSTGCVFVPSSGTKTDLFCKGSITGGTIGRVASATEHFTTLGGSMVNLTVSVAAERTCRMGYAGRFSDPRVHISSNTYTGDCTVRLRNNTTGQEISWTITAGATGLISSNGSTLDFGADDDIFVGWVGGTSGTCVVAGFEITIEEVTATVGLGPLLGGQRNHVVGAGAVLH